MLGINKKKSPFRAINRKKYRELLRQYLPYPLNSLKRTRIKEKFDSITKLYVYSLVGVLLYLVFYTVAWKFKDIHVLYVIYETLTRGVNESWLSDVAQFIAPVIEKETANYYKYGYEHRIPFMRHILTVVVLSSVVYIFFAVLLIFIFFTGITYKIRKRCIKTLCLKDWGAMKTIAENLMLMLFAICAVYFFYIYGNTHSHEFYRGRPSFSSSYLTAMHLHDYSIFAIWLVYVLTIPGFIGFSILLVWELCLSLFLFIDIKRRNKSYNVA